VPIWLEYDDDESKKAHEFEVKISNGQRYDVQYEAGTLDIDAMTAKAEEQYPDLLTQSGKFRYRYRPSQNRQGIDIYANGRLLMTSVFEEIFDLTRNNQYNYFGGILQILPKGRRVRFQRTIRRLDSTRTVNCGEKSEKRYQMMSSYRMEEIIDEISRVGCISSRK